VGHVLLAIDVAAVVVSEVLGNLDHVHEVLAHRLLVVDADEAVHDLVLDLGLLVQELPLHLIEVVDESRRFVGTALRRTCFLLLLGTPFGLQNLIHYIQVVRIVREYFFLGVFVVGQVIIGREVDWRDFVG